MLGLFSKKPEKAFQLTYLAFRTSQMFSKKVVDDLQAIADRAGLNYDEATEMGRRSMLAWLALCELAVRRAFLFERKPKFYDAAVKLFAPRLHGLVDRIGGDRNGLYVFFDETLRGLTEFTLTTEADAATNVGRLEARGANLMSRITADLRFGRDPVIETKAAAIDVILERECRAILRR